MVRSVQTTKDAAASDQSASSGDGVIVHAEPAAIDQVRDLLFGGAQRSIEHQLSELRIAFEQSVERLKTEFSGRMEQLETKVTNLERETEAKRIASLQDIGAAISQLGSAVSNLGTARKER